MTVIRINDILNVKGGAGVYKRICKICGETFESKSPRKLVCYKDHIQICPDCGKPVVWNSIAQFKGCKSCNQKRAVILRKKTMLERYGAETTLTSPELMAKVKNTMKAKYGVTNPMQSSEFLEQARHTCLEKYGTEFPMQNEVVKKKSVSGRMETIDETTQKIKSTCMERYGVENPMFVPEFVDKIANTMIERYGVKSAILVPEFRQKMIETNRERYGVDFYIQLMDETHSNMKRVSIRNKIVGDVLSERGYTVHYEYPISGFAYDIYVEELNLVIEIDPTYTHNAFGNHWENSGKAVNYHAEKTAVAEAAGLRCVHIFDWDDINKVISSLTVNRRIYARNCDVLPLTASEADAFIEEHHIQGKCRGTVVAEGLYYNGELVQVMTFGKPRYNSTFDWELLRLCSATGVSIVGGASKLFKHIVQKYNIHNVISYCDRSKFTGAVYHNIGMILDHTSIPNVHWSMKTKHISGSLLRQRGYDQLFGTNYGKGTSNDALMLQDGWLPVYDCGQSVYTYDSVSKDVPVDYPIIDYKSIAVNRKRFKDKVCKFCGKSFTPNSSFQVYCKGPHYRNCPICGKAYIEKNNDNLKFSPKTCSKECRKKLTEQVCLEKYGVTAPGCIPHKGTKHKKVAK